nr:MFS transporter [Pedococcus bigeumensis]
MVVVAGVVLVTAMVVLPSVPGADDSGAAGQARHAFAPRVLAVLGLCALVFMAIQSALTYLVPFLNQVTGVSGATVSAFLLAYGVSTALGSYAGGRFADSNASRTLVIGTIGVTASLLAVELLAVELFDGSAWLTALAVVGIGLFGMTPVPRPTHNQREERS